MFNRKLLLILGGSLIFCLSACQTPDKANIQLRKDKQDLQDQITQLQSQREADRATIRGYQEHIPTVPVLPEDRIDQLFTTAGLQFGRLTGGDRPDANIPGDTMLKIYVVPIDLQHQALKAAGSFSITLFDLALKDNNKLGQWDFDLNASRQRWFGEGLLYTYVLECPWQTVPTHAKLTARVTFTDALTQRVFSVDKEVTIQPPVATPSSHP